MPEYEEIAAGDKCRILVTKDAKAIIDCGTVTDTLAPIQVRAVCAVLDMVEKKSK